MPEENANAHDTVLAELYAKRDQIEAAISAILFLKGSPATAPEATGKQFVVSNGGVIPANAFFGLGIGDAAKKYLVMAQAKKTLPQIVKGLEAGGMPAQKPNTVYAALRRRESVTGDIMRVGEEWGLKEWFSNIAKPKPAKARKTTKKKNKAKKAASKTPRTAIDVNIQTATKSAKPETAQKQAKQAGEKPISMVNAVHEILTAADKPLHADMLVEKLKQDYGKTKTNVKSVAASLPQDGTKRFYNVGGNTWALEIWRGTDRVKPKAVAASA